MSYSPEKPWSTNANAPKVPYSQHLEDKGNFVGTFIGAIFYGIIIALFFQCMNALFNPINRDVGKIKWPLVAHTVIMFFFVTIFTVISLALESVVYVDTREFSGGGVLPPGTLGYAIFLSSKAVGYVPDIFLFLNNWLADGLLLYRCYVIYSTNYWVIVLPGLMYLAAISMGVAFLYLLSQPDSIAQNSLSRFGTPFLSISLALNLLLTLMIVVRLVWHNRNIRKATGISAGIGGMCKAIATILIESYALYAISAILYIRPYGSVTVIQFLFWPIIAEIQVIAPFLITIRVANRRALTSEAIAFGNPGTIKFRSREELTGDSSTLPGECSITSVGWRGEFPGDSSVGDDTTVDGDIVIIGPKGP